jgi:ankyrin repeat protein
VFATYFYNPTSLTFLFLLPSSLSFYCKFGATALIFASLDGHTAIVQLLLGAGADKEAKDQVREKERERITHTYS